MKSIPKSIIFVCIMLVGGIMAGCNKDNKVDPPSPCFTIRALDANGVENETSTVKVGAIVTFQSCTNLLYSAVYTGDSAYYTLKSTSNQAVDSVDANKHIVYDHANPAFQGNHRFGAGGYGQSLNRAGSFVYTYQEPGIYTVTFIASNVGKHGETVKSTQSQKTLIVTY